MVTIVCEEEGEQEDSCCCWRWSWEFAPWLFRFWSRRTATSLPPPATRHNFELGQPTLRFEFPSSGYRTSIDNDNSTAIKNTRYQHNTEPDSKELCSESTLRLAILGFLYPLTYKLMAALALIPKSYRKYPGSPALWSIPICAALTAYGGYSVVTRVADIDMERLWAIHWTVRG
jgi:hypothetical protein